MLRDISGKHFTNTPLTDGRSAAAIRAMFARLARHYDRTNRWISAGQDGRWKRLVLDLVDLPPGGRLLDVGTGTGGLALEAARRYPEALVAGGDFTLQMLFCGRERAGRRLFLAMDALALPFPSATFDAVVSAYLLRNVIDVPAALREQYRVLKPGGRMVCLETTPPPADLWHWPVRLYLQVILPRLGSLITGETGSYEYLVRSTFGFLPAEKLADCMRQTGFRQVGFRRLMAGTIAVHWGRR